MAGQGREKVERVRMSVNMPKHTHEMVQACANSAGQSMSSWLVLAAMEAAGRWEDPMTGDRMFGPEGTHTGIVGVQNG